VNGTATLAPVARPTVGTKAVGHVCAQGLGVFGPVCLDWMQATSYYFYDPDGNLLESWSPNPGLSSSEQEGTLGA